MKPTPPTQPAKSNVVRYDFKKRRRIESANDLLPEPGPTASPENQAKLAFFTELVERPIKTSVRFVSSAPGVEIPDHLREEPLVVLDWSHRYGLADFQYDEASVRGTLSFNGDPFYVVVPWEAVESIWNQGNPNERQRYIKNQVVALSQEQLTALLQNLPGFVQTQVPSDPIKPTKDTSNGAAETLPPTVAPGLVKRFLGKISRGFDAIFG